MWRTFWTDVRSTQELDDFLNRIEADGYIPAFYREANYPVCIGGRWGNVTRVIVTARRKG